MKIFIFFSFLFFSSIQLVHAEITLSDLGLPQGPAQNVQGEKKMQKLLEVRSSKLKTHEILGLSTWGMMTATMLTGNSALESDLHMYMGITTAALYFTTAYYSLTAPKPKELKDKTRMKWHKGLAWIHLPFMIIAPILGYMYKRNEENHKKHSSIENQHSAFAGVLYGTFTLSASLMLIEF